MNPIIIFDTATRLVYCEDVHQMLAAPAGSTVTYDYRERWIEPTSKNQIRVGGPVILVYCQLPGFDRDVDAKFYWGATVVALLEAMFATTRAATIEAVRVEGGVYHLDLRLGGYLSVPSPLLEEMIDALPSRPGQHFVVQSCETWGSTWLLQSTARSAWASVVDRLQSHGSQFAKDVFWRVESVVDRRTGRVLEMNRSGSFAVRTGRGVRVQLSSYTGKEAGAELAWDVRRIAVTSVSNSPLLSIKSRADTSIRRAGEVVVEVEFPVTSEWRKASETLLMRTEVDGALGSLVGLKFSISHHPARIALAVLLLAVASVGAVGATGLIRNGLWADGLLLASCAFLAGLVASRLLPLR